MKAPCLPCESKDLTIEAATRTVERLMAENVALRDQINALATEIEKLEKDAARYRWLRDKSCAVYLKEGPDSHGWLPSDGEEIDAAADEGIQK